MQEPKNNKILLFMIAFIMLFTIFIPSMAFADEGAGTTQSVTIYYNNTNNTMPVIDITDANGKTQTLTASNTGNKNTNVSLSLGACHYKAYKNNEKKAITGEGTFDVTTSTSKVYLAYVGINLDGLGVLAEEWDNFEPGGTVILKNQNGETVIPGYIYLNGHLEKHEYVVAITGKSTYTYSVKPNDEKFQEIINKAILLQPPVVISKTENASLVPLKRSATFYITKGADFNVYSKGTAHYIPFVKYEPSTVDKTTNPDYDIYTYNKLSILGVHYTAGGGNSGYLRQSRFIDFTKENDNPTLKVDLEPLDNQRRENSGYYEDNLYLNVDDSKYVMISINKDSKLEAFRVWQTVSSLTGNYFIEPDYHYEVIGESVALASGGSPGREYEIVKGIKKGVSVIKITYDAMEWKDNYHGNDDNNVKQAYFNAIDPINTAVVIIDVDGNNDANIKTNIKQTEYDTIYFDSDKTNYAEYTFKPTANEELFVRVHDPLHNTEWGKAWTTYTGNQDGSYTVKLKEGRNIIEVSAGDSLQYYVINAKGLKINIDNKTNPGQPFKVGDTAKVSFKGLSQPIQKMAGIYNPGWDGTCWVQYETENGRVLQSEGVQYDVIIKNDIEFILTEAGTLKLVNGQIHAGHLGSALGTHRVIPDTGMLPNLNASGGTNSPYFSTLPTITVEVADEKGDEELIKLTYAQLNNLRTKLGSSEVAWNLSTASWGQLNAIRNKAQNWQNSTTVQPLSVMPTPLNDDVKITARYRLQSNTADEFTEVTNLTANKLNQIIDELKAGDLAYVEITVTPKDASKGYPQTYTVRAANNVSSDYPYLTNLVLTPVNGKSDMAYLDGLLKPISDGDLDLGYGFIPTRKAFTAHVPYSVDKITLTATKLNADLIKIKDTEVQSGSPSEQIKLSEGKNDITITGTYGGKTITYVVSVTRDGKPSTVILDAEKDSQLIVKNSSDKVIKASADGTYLLPAGTYTYIYSKTGYLTATGKFIVAEDTTNITLPELQKAEQTYGNVIVRSLAQNRILRDNTTIAYTADSGEDLAKQAYVSYNYGGYTALHALIEAFNTGISKVGFSCYKGVFIPKVDIDKTGHGTNAGWVCEVNGKACDPTTTLVNDGDQIDFYYNADYAGMKHAWFTKNAVSVSAGESADLTLMATAVKNDGTPAKGLEGATIMVNGAAVGVTDADGNLTVPSEQIKEPGQYTITAQKVENGKNILTHTYSVVTVKKGDIAVVPGKTTVSFRLIGDAKHDGISKHGTYVTWIATEKYTFEKESVSVYEVFTKALDEAGLDYVGANKNYVSKIKAPKAYGGYWLAEFSNGQNSGWMYTVNGSHPELGLKDCYVTTGDVIIWHYVDDYKLETSFDGSVPSYPNRWLEAKDENPPTDGTIIDMSQGNLPAEKGIETGDVVTGTVTAAAKVDSNGKATASISKSDIKEAIAKVLKMAEEAEKENGTVPTKKVIIDISGTEKANSLETTIQKAAALELSSNVDVVVIKTAIGEVSFDKASFAAMAKETTGDLKFTIGKDDASKVISELKSISDENKATITGRPIFTFSAELNGKKISEFNGEVTVRMPYEKPATEKAEALVVYWLQDSGKLTPVWGGKLSSDGKYMEMTTKHWSKYVIGYHEVNFTDTKKHWANSNITYLAVRNVIKGKNESTFEPNSQITRAEFVQILANLSGADLSVYKEQSSSTFNDVTGTSWYAQAAAWAKEQGIAEGSSGKFNPNANITRQDMAVMITRYVSTIEKRSLELSSSEITFADDAQIASYAKEAVVNMQRAGIINGVANSDKTVNFNPTNNATRAEAATMIANYTNK